MAEIEFREWTAERVMRAPSFKGLRDDKAAGDVRLEERRHPAGLAAGAVRRGRRARRWGHSRSLTSGRQLRITNWDKVLFPETGFTKGDLVAYYARIAPAVLPHLHDRPLTLKRYPNGVDSQYFYEKQSPSHRPDWVADEADRRRQLHARAGSAHADLARKPRRHRAAHVALARRGRRAADDAGVRPRPGLAGDDRRVLRGGARAPADCSPSWDSGRWSRHRARRGYRCTSR